MSGWATTILVAGSSRRNDRDLSRGTAITREGADSLSIASAMAGVGATAVSAVAAAREAHSALARLFRMVRVPCALGGLESVGDGACAVLVRSGGRGDRVGHRLGG